MNQQKSKLNTHKEQPKNIEQNDEPTHIKKGEEKERKKKSYTQYLDLQ